MTDAPPDLVLTLPVPPSANRLWAFRGARKPHLTPEYAAWKREAGWIAKTQLIQWGPLAGHFRVRIEVPPSRRDLGNNEKALLDLAQSVGAIENDRLAVGIDLAINPDRTDCLLAFWRAAPVLHPTRPRAHRPSSRPTPAQVARAEKLRLLPR